jgi:hypothetical protein
MPTYKLDAIKFRCIDESGIDWTGSDEPYFVFTTSLEQSPERLTTVRSQEFGNVDSGDTRNFSPPVVFANNVPGGVAANVVVMEADNGNIDTVVSRINQALTAARWASKVWNGGVPGDIDKRILDYLRRWYNDDVLSQRTLAWANWELAEGAPTVGSSVTEEVGFRGSGSNYTVTFRVTRVS